MDVGRGEFVKRIFLFIMVGVLTISSTAVVFANGEGAGIVGQTPELLDEVEFDEEEVPLSQVPDAGDDTGISTTHFNVISAIGSYSLLIPAILLAALALVVAAIFRKKDKAATIK